MWFWLGRNCPFRVSSLVCATSGLGLAALFLVYLPTGPLLFLAIGLLALLYVFAHSRGFDHGYLEADEHARYVSDLGSEPDL